MRKTRLLLSLVRSDKGHCDPYFSIHNDIYILWLSRKLVEEYFQYFAPVKLSSKCILSLVHSDSILTGGVVTLNRLYLMISAFSGCHVSCLKNISSTLLQYIKLSRKCIISKLNKKIRVCTPTPYCKRQ